MSNLISEILEKAEDDSPYLKSRDIAFRVLKWEKKTTKDGKPFARVWAQDPNEPERSNDNTFNVTIWGCGHFKADRGDIVEANASAKGAYFKASLYKGKPELTLSDKVELNHDDALPMGDTSKKHQTTSGGHSSANTGHLSERPQDGEASVNAARKYLMKRANAEILAYKALDYVKTQVGNMSIEQEVAYVGRAVIGMEKEGILSSLPASPLGATPKKAEPEPEPEPVEPEPVEEPEDDLPF